MKAEKEKLNSHLVEIENHASEIAKNNSVYLQQISDLEVANRCLTNQVNEMQGKLREMETSMDDALRSRGKNEKWLEDLKKLGDELRSENDGLKVEVQRGVEDVAKALGDGYNRCLARMKAAGVDTATHSIEQYI